MKTKVFLDTNVLVDVLAGSRKYSQSSRVIFELIKRGQIEAFISTQSVLDTSYALRREPLGKEFLSFVEWICSHINVGGINSFNLLQACRNYSGDFEDDALYSWAVDSGCDLIISGDKDFIARYSGVEESPEFLPPDEFVNSLKEN
jgi:predicted nucleic acid-binding protein